MCWVKMLISYHEFSPGIVKTPLALFCKRENKVHATQYYYWYILKSELSYDINPVSLPQILPSFNCPFHSFISSHKELLSKTSMFVNHLLNNVSFLL